jgi:hypothetical protein
MELSESRTQVDQKKKKLIQDDTKGNTGRPKNKIQFDPKREYKVIQKWNTEWFTK